VLCGLHGNLHSRPISSGDGLCHHPTPACEPRKAERSDRREFHEALLEAGTFEDLPGKWQAAIMEAKQNRPELRVVY
jgi:hypothetical protein